MNTPFHDISLAPLQNPDGVIISTSDEYSARLDIIRKREPLRDACSALHISLPKSANLERLRSALIEYWFPSGLNSTAPGASGSNITSQPLYSAISGNKLDDEALVSHFGLDGAAAEELLGYDDENELNDAEEEFVEEVNEPDDPDNQDDSENDDMDISSDFESFIIRTRVNEAKRSEANRRAGGVKTQSAVFRDWEIFCRQALDKGELKDNIVDCHHLILYIQYSAERPKRTRKGVDIPGTFLGASQLKKLYFGALRIQKMQEAEDSKLEQTRPAKSVHVWDCIKGRMNEALTRVRNGLVPEEDAPDIVANTFLANVTDEQMEKVGEGFLMHRELRSVINGHLAWSCQNASGNRGDDFRALRLAELQPYVFLHPNKQTAIECVLGLQGEEKAAANRGLRTKVNPVYTVFIAHKDPTMCPLGAFSFYHHFIHDVMKLGDTLQVDWSLNKSWRQVRVLHGKTSPTTPYHEQSLYNLYVKAFARAAFMSKIKAHLPRHILGYNQERMGVDPTNTSKLGWVRGETYFDTYAPAIPKEAVLGAHGYKIHEVYDPIWRRVHVPEVFLGLVCPMAEEIHAQIVGKANLSGAANYWSMVISLRPYLFQCGAAIFQKYPNSGLFRLPALANPQVQHWMKTEYLTSLAQLQANAGSAIDIERIQNSLLRLSLEQLRDLMASQAAELKELRLLLQRRTEVLSPTKGFSNSAYHKTFEVSTQIPQPVFTINAAASASISSSDDTGAYIVHNLNEQPGSPLRAFANGSPKGSFMSREKTQVDLVLPDVDAFSNPNEPRLFWPPILGQKSVTWDQVFKLIKRPDLLWNAWCPSKTLNKYTLDEQWTCYIAGEPVFDKSGTQTGVKPPLHQVELYFQSSWRTQTSARKAWQRFREIPEYIQLESSTRGISPQVVIEELKLSFTVEGGKLKGLSAITDEIYSQRTSKAKALKDIPSSADTDNASVEGSAIDAVPNDAKKRQPPIAPRRRLKKPS